MVLLLFHLTAFCNSQTRHFYSIQKMTTQCETETSRCYILIKLVDLMSDRWSKMVFVLICCETDTVVGVRVGVAYSAGSTGPGQRGIWFQ